MGLLIFDNLCRNLLEGRVGAMASEKYSPLVGEVPRKYTVAIVALVMTLVVTIGLVVGQNVRTGPKATEPNDTIQLATHGVQWFGGGIARFQVDSFGICKQACCSMQTFNPTYQAETAANKPDAWMFHKGGVHKHRDPCWCMNFHDTQPKPNPEWVAGRCRTK